MSEDNDSSSEGSAGSDVEEEEVAEEGATTFVLSPDLQNAEPQTGRGSEREESGDGTGAAGADAALKNDDDDEDPEENDDGEESELSVISDDEVCSCLWLLHKWSWCEDDFEYLMHNQQVTLTGDA